MDQQEKENFENPRVEVTFTYDIADQYLYQTNTLKKTAEWTYKGPEHLWIFIDKATMKISSRFHYTLRDDGHLVPCPEDMIKVELDAKKWPCIASLIHNEYTYGELLHTVEQLPEGYTYGHPDPIPPDHTYELIEIVWDADSQDFVKPYPWKKPHMDWETLKSARDAILKNSDQQYHQATDPEIKQKLSEYRQKLRDLPKTFEGIDPWKVPFPADPVAVVMPTTPGDLGPQV